MPLNPRLHTSSNGLELHRVRLNVPVASSRWRLSVRHLSQPLLKLSTSCKSSLKSQRWQDRGSTAHNTARNQNDTRAARKELKSGPRQSSAYTSAVGDVEDRHKRIVHNDKDRAKTLSFFLQGEGTAAIRGLLNPAKPDPTDAEIETRAELGAGKVGVDRKTISGQACLWSPDTVSKDTVSKDNVSKDNVHGRRAGDILDLAPEINQAKKPDWHKDSEVLNLVLHATGHSFACATTRNGASQQIGPAQENYPHSFGTGGFGDASKELKDLLAGGNRRQSVLHITARYIGASHVLKVPITSPNIHELGFDVDVYLKVSDSQSKLFLKQRGFKPRDVATWSWIITQRNSDKAVEQLLKSCNQVRRNRYPAVPMSVTLFLLRRAHISAPALKKLVIHCGDRIFKRHNAHFETRIRKGTGTVVRTRKFGVLPIVEYTASYKDMDEISFFLIIIRLIRHARRVWPEALPTIAEMFCQFYDQRQEPNVSRPKVEPSHIYNKILRLLALPSDQSPFLSVLHHQEAQFKLLRQMALYTPPLLLNREGFRAIVQLQLRHRKTPLEREWSTMKALSWPPFKQNKSGLDESIGPESGRSRARQALERASAAGYISGEWEKAALVLSGWDTDQKPVIQRRGVLPLSSGIDMLPDPQDTQSTQNKEDSDFVWAARVRATRTLQEAWSVFFKYRNLGMPETDSVYFAMAEKIIYDVTARQGHHMGHHGEESLKHSIWRGRELAARDPSLVLPGDGFEVSEPPTDPRERIYVPSEPPDLQDFLQLTMRDGIVFHHRFVTLLLRHSTDLKQCALVFNNSKISPEGVSMLLGRTTLERDVLREIPDHVISAFLEFLSQQLSESARLYGKQLIGMKFNFRDTVPTKTRTGIDNNFKHAFRIVMVAQSQCREHWFQLLSLLSTNIFKHSYSSPAKKPAYDIRAWTLTIQLMGEMYHHDISIDSKAFRHVCVTYTRAALAAYELRASRTRGKSHPREVDSSRVLSTHASQHRAARVLDAGLERLKMVFRMIITGRPEELSEQSLTTAQGTSHGESLSTPFELSPKTLEAHHPANVHAYVRALGAARDKTGLYEVLCWMVWAKNDVQRFVQEVANGQKQLRMSVVALRAFLKDEDLSQDDIQNDETNESSTDLLEKAESMVNSTEYLGGWPSDEEVEDYRRNNTLDEQQSTLATS